MNFLTSTILLVTLGFFVFLIAPFAGVWVLDFHFHSTVLFAGAASVSPVLFIAAIYEGVRS